MNLAHWIQAHRRSILFLVLAFGLAGLASSLNLPVSLFPHVTFPRIQVGIEAGNRPVDRMAIEVTRLVEEAVRAVPGVRHVRSTTSRGSAEISITFGWGEDMVSAMLQIESGINQVRGSLPPNTVIDVRRMDPTVFPILGYSLISDHHSLTELHDLAFYQVRPVLSTIAGVARIGVLGGAAAEYQVMVDPVKLDSFGLTLNDLARTLSATNVVTAVGRLEDHFKLYLVMLNTQFHDLAQLEQTIVRSGPDGMILLEDIATITLGTVPQWTRVTADGQDAVLFQVYQQPGGNTVTIAGDVAHALTDLQKQLPVGVRVVNWYDQSQLILASASSVRDAVIMGIILASLVILLFLRNVKVTLIAAVTVPTVLAVTILLLFVLNMSFNIMTLGGMAAAVGLVIDDAIVMIEHVIRRLQGGIGPWRDRVLAAAQEFTRPLVGSSATTIIIFVPLAFLSGVTGAFFKALSLTMAASLVISFLIAWLAVPLLALHVLREHDAEPHRGGTWTARVHTGYTSLMTRVLRAPWLMAVVLVPLLVLGWVGYRQIGSGFMPVMDEGGFVLDYLAPPGTSISETDRLVRQLETILRATPEVQTYSRRTGLRLSGGLTEANNGDLFVRLMPLPRRPIHAVMDEVRQRIEHHIPGLQIEMAQLMEDLIGDLTAVPEPIEVKLFSDDGPLLREVAGQVADTIGTVRGIVEVKNGLVVAGDALEIRVDREKAALEGLLPDAVTLMLTDYVTGAVTTHVQEGVKMTGVRVWVHERTRATARDLGMLRLRAPDGHLFPLKRVATMEVMTGQPQIKREDLKTMVPVTARISGRDLGSTIVEMTERLDRPGFLPKGVYYHLGGLYQEQQTAFRGLLGVFIAAAVLVFVVLLFLYESLRVAALMLLTTLLTIPAVFIGLWWTGTELNVTSLMGLTMVLGIVTEVGIFYYCEYQDLPRSVDLRGRLIQAGLNRLRPITMTTLAAILALLPLALAIGEGSAMQKPLAIAIISGLLVQVPLVVIVLPTFLLLLTGNTTPSRT
ncbi:MAG: efflux RND transporter permease subunit [Nitrospira sp.]|jgi:CzcA family heavy metal efflux pump|nr:efflux RND transporter permease subunit [Nitrospira sp.]HQY59267.1 efflux RND transporter permease subunit [Nitrospira sp.]HRA95383.1 efflux RND transporter permease subunit [Nitrospira sp.]